MTSSLRTLPRTLAESWEAPLDRIADVGASLSTALRPGTVKDLLSGTWLGHPLHPMLTDVPIGCWTCSLALDALAGERGREASTTLVGLGVLAAVPTAVSGWSDWVDTEDEERRIGVAHAVGNLAATALYAASWLARRRGARRGGVALAIVGGGIASATAYLGGHLVYGRGLGVDRTTFDRLPRRWTRATEAASLGDGKPVAVDVRGVKVLLVRRGEELLAIHDVCSHRGGPLHQGEVGTDTVTCPWHGSCFGLRDGEIVRGPATAPQPTFETRLVDGSVEIRTRPRG
jgi:nitrite reductase/ring-hydroxylating ferredoxin subunit/uncharacterized membrane protein